jgi:hypothetical protein
VPTDFPGHFGIYFGMAWYSGKTAFDYIDIQGMPGAFAVQFAALINDVLDEGLSFHG